MQVIMIKTGELKQVPDGYARNYLLPNKLATAATETAVETAKATQAKIAADQQDRQAEYTALSNALADTQLVLAAPASEQGKLFAAVHANAVIKALAEQKLAVSEELMQLPVIKRTGDYTVIVRLPGQKAVSVALTVKAA